MEHIIAREYLRELIRVATRMAVNIVVGVAAATVIGASYGNLAAATATLMGIILAYLASARLFNLDYYGGYETISATILTIGVGIIGMAAANTYQPMFLGTDPQEALSTISTMAGTATILVQILDVPRLTELYERYRNIKRRRRCDQ